jgi:hypothetical protein
VSTINRNSVADQPELVTRISQDTVALQPDPKCRASTGSAQPPSCLEQGEAAFVEGEKTWSPGKRRGTRWGLRPWTGSFGPAGRGGNEEASRRAGDSGGFCGDRASRPALHWTDSMAYRSSPRLSLRSSQGVAGLPIPGPLLSGPPGTPFGSRATADTRAYTLGRMNGASPKYDRIGQLYGSTRRADPRIAAAIEPPWETRRRC